MGKINNETETQRVYGGKEGHGRQKSKTRNGYRNLGCRVRVFSNDRHDPCGILRMFICTHTGLLTLLVRRKAAIACVSVISQIYIG